MEQLETNPGQYLPDVEDGHLSSEVVKVGSPPKNVIKIQINKIKSNQIKP